MGLACTVVDVLRCCRQGEEGRKDSREIVRKRDVTSFTLAIFAIWDTQRVKRVKRDAYLQIFLVSPHLSSSSTYPFRTFT